MKTHCLIKSITKILTIFLTISSFAFAGMFISEYAEGSSYNKYIEIYNGTGSDVDLSTYELWKISNGGDWAEGEYALSGTLVDGDVYVVCHSSSDDAIKAECDMEMGLWWNGDDAVGLAENDVLLDAVGSDGADPGSQFDVCGNGDTKDNTLVRNADVSVGNTDWATASCEYTVYSNNTWDNLGSHTCDVCGGGSEPTVCASDLECDDTNNYTVDSCTDGSCTYVTLDCLSDADCDDSNACTTSLCLENTCDTYNINDDTVCDDGTGWTSNDVCYDGACAGSALSTVSVTFNLDLNIQGADSPQIRIAYGCLSGCEGEHNSSTTDEWLNNTWVNLSDDDADGVWSYTADLATGVDYNYSYKNGGYESPADSEDCFGEPYGNARHVVPGDSDQVLDSVCWESCGACIIPVDCVGTWSESSACSEGNGCGTGTTSQTYTVTTDAANGGVTCEAATGDVATEDCAGTGSLDNCSVCNGNDSTCTDRSGEGSGGEAR